MGAPLPVPQAPSSPSPPSLCLFPLLDDAQREAIREIVSDMLISAAWDQEAKEKPVMGENHG